MRCRRRRWDNHLGVGERSRSRTPSKRAGPARILRRIRSKGFVGSCTHDAFISCDAAFAANLLPRMRTELPDHRLAAAKDADASATLAAVSQIIGSPLRNQSKVCHLPTVFDILSSVIDFHSEFVVAVALFQHPY